jgi:transposase
LRHLIVSFWRPFDESFTLVSRELHREFLGFLRVIDQQTPPRLDLHLIVDNYATDKTPAVKRRLAPHPRLQPHFTPTSASWLNMVERFFAEITRKPIRRGIFKSVAELNQAIMDYLENHNADPKPFIWTKSARVILDNVARAKHALESVHELSAGGRTRTRTLDPLIKSPRKCYLDQGVFRQIFSFLSIELSPVFLLVGIVDKPVGSLDAEQIGRAAERIRP